MSETMSGECVTVGITRNRVLFCEYLEVFVNIQLNTHHRSPGYYYRSGYNSL